MNVDLNESLISTRLLNNLSDNKNGLVIFGLHSLLSSKLEKFIRRRFGKSFFLNAELCRNTDHRVMNSILTLINPKAVILSFNSYETDFIAAITAMQLFAKKHNIPIFIISKENERVSNSHVEIGKRESNEVDIVSIFENDNDTFLMKVPSVFGFNEYSNLIEYSCGFSTDGMRKLSGQNLGDWSLADHVADDITSKINVLINEGFPGRVKNQIPVINIREDVGTVTNKDLLTVYGQKGCSVKYLYKAKPTEIVDGINIAEFRMHLGRELGRHIPKAVAEAVDYIVPVPNSGVYYAVGLSDGIGKTYLPTLSKNNIAERAFEIQNVDMRRRYLTSNMNVNATLITNKKVLLVDEAIFTGATLKSVCEILRKSNVAEIHLAIPSPMCTNQCSFLVQPERELLLNRINKRALEQYFDVDSITFISFEKYSETVNKFRGDKDSCTKCFQPKENY
jgi:amidophosphoribosyltransferase